MGILMRNGVAIAGGLTFDDIYPVGSIYMSVVNTNPGLLFGGTWEAWGTGRVPVGVDANDTSFDTVEETGGSKTESYTPGGSTGNTTLTAAQSGVPAHSHGLNSHTHSVGAHSHGLNSHKHSVGAHAHGLNSHTHSVGAHAHGLNSHTHSVGAHAHGLNSHTHSMAHKHKYSVKYRPYYGSANGSDNNMIQSFNYTNSAWTTGVRGGAETVSKNNGHQAGSTNTSIDWYYSESYTSHPQSDTTASSTGGPSTTSTANSAAFNSGGPSTANTANSTAFNSGGPSTANTANSTAFDTGAATGSTANSAAFDTGAATGSTANNTAGAASEGHNHSFTGTEATISHVQPYITCYMWKRTA